jgi:hypothetical protein
LLFAIWIRFYLRTRKLREAVLHPAAITAFIFAAALGFLLALQTIGNSTPLAICAERNPVRSGPGDRFVEITQIEPGTKLRLTGPRAEEKNEQWLQVRYAQPARIGWIRASSLLLL